MNRFALAACLTACSVFAQAPGLPGTAPASAQRVPEDERSTPRGTVFGFLEAARQSDYRRAASYLNLPAEARENGGGAELARKLKEVFDRQLALDPVRLSSVPEGDQTDGLDPNIEQIGAVRLGGRAWDIQLQRTTRDGQSIWLFSERTVSITPELYERLETTWAESRLPAVLLVEGPLGTAAWQWLALLILAVLSWLIGSLLVRVVMRILRPLLSGTAKGVDDLLVPSMERPIRLLLAVALVRAGVEAIAPPVLLRAYILLGLTALTYLGLAWLAMRVIDVIAAQIVLRLSSAHRVSVASVIPLGRRTAKAGTVLIAILAALSTWGYNITALLAGLGVGGLAVALAAQKTIENLFGGVALTTDRPVLVGDFCRFGERTGIVEDIGLRSTRIRTLDRTLVTVPNAQFSSMLLENFGARDKIFLHPILGLRRDTTPEQMRFLIRELREVLLRHKWVDPEPARVRFIGIGTYSLDIEIFAYVKTNRFDEFLVVQEEILLSFLEVIRDAGTALAVPAQMNILSRDHTAPPRQAGPSGTIVRSDQA